MNESRARIIKSLAITAEVCGSQLSEGALVVMAMGLSSYESEDVEKALKRVIREHKGRLSLAAIIERIDDPSASMGVDQAWAIAIAARRRGRTELCTYRSCELSSQSLPVRPLEQRRPGGCAHGVQGRLPQVLSVNECGDEIFVSLAHGIAEQRRSGD